MRVVTMLAAVAALWAVPAAAVQVIDLTPLNPNAVAHKKITLTGLTGADVVKATGELGTLTYNDWLKMGSGWYLDGNDFSGVFNCTTTTHCDFNYSTQSDLYPVGATALLSINIVANEIFVDWKKAASSVCFQLSDAERTSGEGHKCGFNWRTPDLFLFIDVSGPSSQTFGYTVENYVPTPVPEPATWGLMLLGIGFAGVALRRHARIGVAPLGGVKVQSSGL